MNTTLDTPEGVRCTARASRPSPIAPTRHKGKTGLKRSRSQFQADDIGLEPFQIRTLDSSRKAFLTARPLLLLARLNFPLSYLDCAMQWDKGDCLPRNFVANIQSLEGVESRGNCNEHGPKVLIVQLGAFDRLYVVERIRKHVYTLCRLGNWVSLETVQRLPKTLRGGSSHHVLDNEDFVENWWTKSALDDSTIDLVMKRANVTHESLPSQTTHGSEPLTSQAPSHQESESSGAMHQMEGPIVPATIDQTGSIEDTYKHVVEKYLDMLYMSKASLAYFAKGPLSRARAAFKPTEGCVRQPYELAEFLRAMVYSSIMMDKKYKTSLPTIILSVLTTETTTKQKKRKKSQSFKPGKDCLLPTESETIQKWWNTEEPQQIAGFLCDKPEAFIKTKLSSLRFRENLLQLILLLETQAIESTPGGKRPSLESAEVDIAETHGESKKAPKVRKPLDLKDVMGELVDRLTIWQSVGSSELDKIDSQTSEAEKLENDTPDLPASTQNDALKDFHSQVIVPFYAARLPRVVDELARKFGCLTRKSPNKASSASRRRSNKVEQEVESASLPREKAQRSLQKARNNGQSGKLMQPPPLTRSSTDPVQSSIKRERSSTPSATPGHYESKQRSLSRSNSISQAKRLSQREVDLSTITKFNESKSKKKAAIAMELKGAIAALKRPNRNLVVKEYYDSADSVRPPLQERPNKHQNANPKTNAKLIEVSATPRRANKLKDCGTSLLPDHRDISGTGDEMHDCSVVPASAMKPLPVNATQEDNQMHVNYARQLSVVETPSRGPRRHKPISMETVSQLGDSADQFVMPASHVKPKVCSTSFFSPQAGEKKKRLSPAQIQSIFSTPTRGHQGSSPGTLGKIQFTAAADTSDAETAQEAPLPLLEPCLSAPTSSSVPKRSIYETLGWDDDDMDELL